VFHDLSPPNSLSLAFLVFRKRGRNKQSKGCKNSAAVLLGNHLLADVKKPDRFYNVDSVFVTLAYYSGKVKNYGSVKRTGVKGVISFT
jgi:hypothetical protein